MSILQMNHRLKLEKGYHNGPTHSFRIRCKSILLKSKVNQLPKIVEILEEPVPTIYAWIKRYEENGYRNRRLDDFLKELDLTEGRSTGVPTIQAKLAENGSPRAIFETTDDRLTFLVTIPVHKGCCESSETKSESSGTQPKSSGTQLKSSGTKPESSETNGKSSGTRQKTSDKIIEMIKKDPQITAPQIAMELGISTRGVEKNLRQLRETGTLKRVGSPTFGGYWEIVDLDND